MKELKDELQTVKLDNEIILELNHILLDKIHNRGEYKINAYETDSGTISYKHKGKKLNFFDSESNYSSGVKVRSYKQKYKYTSESSESD